MEPDDAILTSSAIVESSDGERSGGGRGERQLLVDDEMFPKRDSKEHAKEARAGCQSDKLAEIGLGQLREKVQTVHGRDSRHEQDPKSTGSCRSCLNGTILLGTEVATEELAEEATLGNGARDGLQDGETEDSTKELRAEGEAWNDKGAVMRPNIARKYIAAVGVTYRF